MNCPNDAPVDKEGTISRIITACSGWAINGNQMAVLTQLLRFAPIVELKEAEMICRKAKDMRPKEAKGFRCVCGKQFSVKKNLDWHYDNVCEGAK